MSAIISVAFSQTTGWPIDGVDTNNHDDLISITMANHHIANGKDILPVRNLVIIDQTLYPKGTHAAAAGLSFLSGLFPAVSIVSIFSFVLFLIPPLLTSLVYRFTNSIFFSAITFIITYWRPTVGEIWEGDIILNNWIEGLFSSAVGILIVIISFMILIEFFEKDSKKSRLFVLFIFIFIALIVAYFAFIAMPAIAGLIGFITYYIKNKKKLTAVSVTLIGAFASIPLWSFIIFSHISSGDTYVFEHEKYVKHFPFNPMDGLFPFWISTAAAFVCSIIFVRDKKFRYLSIIFIVLGLIHMLSISDDIYLKYFFYNQSLRSIGLMFLLSVAINLIVISHLIKKSLTLGKMRPYFIKLSALCLLSFALLPSFVYWYAMTTQPWDVKDYMIPSGNDRNVIFWLLKNSSPNDLVLNDLSNAATYFTGFRAQSLINTQEQSAVISHAYDGDNNTFNVSDNASKETLMANLILKNPWDYYYIEKTLKDLKIKFVYISERIDSDERCQGDVPAACYPNSDNWAWKHYSANSRIAMYENNP
ncbi:MAG: hypothetical protein KGL95_12585, partial [Patescibacteria group bacterium]|nr:hypothetical protein [Patescibacteria group bacterium]